MRNWNTDKGYKVYYNLHLKTYSILGWDADKNGWRLKAYADNLVLTDVEFRVSEKGRQRVIKEKRKNVHAFAIAKVVQPISFDRVPDLIVNKGYRSATYNPYLYDSFVDVKTKVRVKGCKGAILFDKRIAYLDHQTNTKTFEENLQSIYNLK